MWSKRSRFTHFPTDGSSTLWALVFSFSHLLSAVVRHCVSCMVSCFRLFSKRVFKGSAFCHVATPATSHASKSFRYFRPRKTKHARNCGGTLFCRRIGSFNRHMSAREISNLVLSPRPGLPSTTATSLQVLHVFVQKTLEAHDMFSVEVGACLTDAVIRKA